MIYSYRFEILLFEGRLVLPTYLQTAISQNGKSRDCLYYLNLFHPNGRLEAKFLSSTTHSTTF